MINRRCRKCGNLNVYPVYDKSDDTLEFNCKDCGYTWKDKPLDREEDKQTVKNARCYIGVPSLVTKALGVRND